MGIGLPDKCAYLGINYKIFDFLEIESQGKLYFLGTYGLNGGLKYFYNFRKGEDYPFSSIFTGVSYELLGGNKMYYSDQTLGDGVYRLNQNEYLIFSVGYRYYESFAAGGVITFFKDIYFQPTLSYALPISAKPYYVLVEGKQNPAFEKAMNRVVSPIINLEIRFGLVF